MVSSKFNNKQLGKEVKKIITNGYTVKAGNISGNSIETIEDCNSFVYYENSEKRDSDLKLLLSLIEDARK